MNNPMNRVVKKRQRSENWLRDDKSLLMNLAKTRISIVDNRNCDTNTNRLKHAAWTEIQNKFNRVCKGTKRTIPQLKLQWKIQKTIKKKMNSEEVEQLTTGGWPLLEVGPNSLEEVGVWQPHGLITNDDEFNSEDQIEVKVPISSPNDNTHEESLLQEDDQSNDQEESSDMIMKEDDNVQSEEIETEDIRNKISPRTTAKRRHIRKDMGTNKTATFAASIANFEIKCRRELHDIQIENERRKAMNLDLEEILLKRKIEYYDKKIKLLN